MTQQVVRKDLLWEELDLSVLSVRSTGSRARGSVPVYPFKSVLVLRRIRILFQL